MPWRAQGEQSGTCLTNMCDEFQVEASVRERVGLVRTRSRQRDSS